MLNKLIGKEHQCRIDTHLKKIVSYLVNWTSLFIEKEINFLFYHLSSNPLLVTTQASNCLFIILNYNIDLWYKDIYLFYT